MSYSRVSPDEPLHTDADLLRWARFVNHGVDPVRCTLWVLLLDEHDMPLPVILPIEDIPQAPDDEAPQVVRNLGKIAQDMIPGGAMVLMLERPGLDQRMSADDAWHDLLRAELNAAGVRVRAIFLAACGQVWPFTLDDAA